MVLLRAFMFRAVLIGSVAALASACDVGEVDIGGGPTPDAPVVNSPKAMAFASNVKPLAETRGCMTATTCHGIQAPILLSYGQLLPKYTTGPSATNIMINKDVAPNTPTPGMHSGLPYFSAAEKTMVAAWIDMAGP